MRVYEYSGYISTAKLNYLHNTTSNIQDQLNSIQKQLNTRFTPITIPAFNDDAQARDNGVPYYGLYRKYVPDSDINKPGIWTLKIRTT